MKKSNTDHLFTQAFRRLCESDFLLFMAVYLPLPVLPFEVARQWNLPLTSGCLLYVLFVVGMLAVGPFHAYLGDAYKRKHLLTYFLVVLSLSMLGYEYLDWSWWPTVAFAQGASFGLASTAAVTVSIDVTISSLRTQCNKAVACFSRAGVLVGALGGWLLWQEFGFFTLLHVAAAVGIVGSLVSSRIYLAFRAPIGLPLCSLDRFLLPGGWFLALNVFFLAFAPGVLLPFMPTGGIGAWVSAFLLLLALALLLAPFTVGFVDLSHHCQRGTANTTCQLSVEVGLTCGLATGVWLLSEGMSLADGWKVGGCALAVAILLRYTLTAYYFPKKRVR